MKEFRDKYLTLDFWGFPVDDLRTEELGNDGMGRKKGGCCVDETEFDAGETSISMFAKRGLFVFWVILENFKILWIYLNVITIEWWNVNTLIAY